MTYLTSIVLFTIAYVVYVSSSITPKPNNVENSPGKWSNILDIQVAMETDGTSVNLKSVINGNRKSISTNFDKCSNNSKTWNQDEVSPLVARSTNDGFDDSNLSTKLDFLKAEVKTIKNALNDLQNENRKFSINTNPELCMKKKTSLGVHHNSYISTLVNRSSYPKNCREIQKKGNNVTGIYEIFPTNSKAPFPVICDMEIKGGGWTTIQKRFDGSQDFTLGWRDYKFGFGDLDGEFWLGLENIYALTGFEIAELLVEIADRDNVFAYAHYGTFAVSPEPEGYELKHLSGFSGDAGDSLTYSLGQKFSTKDLDYTYNCVATYPGGWWYKDCHISNLNGKHINVDLPSKFKYQGVHWKTFRSHEYCHSKSRMFVRPAK